MIHKQAAIDLLHSDVWIQAVSDAEHLAFDEWQKLSSDDQARNLTQRREQDGFISRALRMIADA